MGNQLGRLCRRRTFSLCNHGCRSAAQRHTPTGSLGHRVYSLSPGRCGSIRLQHPKRNGLVSSILAEERREERRSSILNRQRNPKHTSHIGILGCSSEGAGVDTSFAISLGTYCASRRRLRTACLELHKRSELARLIPESALADSIHRHALQCSKAPDTADTSKAEFFHFRLHGVDYYRIWHRMLCRAC